MILIGERYFTIQFNASDGKFTVKHCVWSGGFIDIKTKENNLVFKQYDQVVNKVEELNKSIQNCLSNYEM